MVNSRRWIHRLYKHLRPRLNNLGIIDLVRKFVSTGLRRQIALWIGLKDFDISSATGTKLPDWTNSLLTHKPTELDGINFIGDLRADVGVSQATRAYVQALQAVSIRVAYTEMSHENTTSSHSLPLNLGSQTPYRFTWVDIGIRSYYQAVTRLHSDNFVGKYIIANWAWELSTMLVISPEHFLLMNEIWTYSEFSRQAIASISPKPVYIMPIPIVAQPSPTVSRHDFDLPEDRFIVLCSFDPTSSIARKNPFAVIDAFRKAFGNCQTQDAPLLVIKTYNSKRVVNSHYLKDLHTAINSVNGLLVDTYMARQIYIDLLSVCDVYISLHRSEGFGLNIAEAMALGKPVIATAYSGNMDFMTDENSLGVQYELRAIHQDDHRYQLEFLDIYSEGHMWAEPSIHHAAEYLDALVNSPDQYIKLGHQASHDIKRYYNPTSIGNRIKQHLSTRII